MNGGALMEPEQVMPMHHVASYNQCYVAGNTHLQIPSQRVYNLLCLNIMVGKDVLPVRDRIQRLLQPHALALHMFLESIGRRLSNLSLDRLRRVNRGVLYEFLQRSDSG